MDKQPAQLNATGEWGEIYANRYVRNRGFTVLTANYRCRFGEADIICKDRRELVIVEVKARRGKMIAGAAEYVSEEKQHKLALTASLYLKNTGIKAPVRFDVCEVYFEQADNDDFKNYRINYIEDAFRIR